MWLGVLLFFDRKLIAMGDILFLAGFAFLSGFQRTIRYVAPPAQHCPEHAATPCTTAVAAGRR